jgi:PAS domain-containing protein
MGSESASSVSDKRRGRPRDESAIEFLRDFPALLALDRLPVPILAVDDAGEIAFANKAFAAMTGYSREDLATMNAQSLVACITPADSGVVAVLREHANSVIRLFHADGTGLTPQSSSRRPGRAPRCRFLARNVGGPV